MWNVTQILHVAPPGLTPTFQIVLNKSDSGALQELNEHNAAILSEELESADLCFVKPAG